MVLFLYTALSTLEVTVIVYHHVVNKGTPFSCLIIIESWGDVEAHWGCSTDLSAGYKLPVTAICQPRFQNTGCPKIACVC